MPVEETATAPFISKNWLLSHNGVVNRAVLGPHANAESACDSALLAAHLFDAGVQNIAGFVTDLGARDPYARLNLLATDGNRVLATTWNDTLSILQTDQGVLLASEPFDDNPAWVDVDDHSVVDVRREPTGITITTSSLETQ